MCIISMKPRGVKIPNKETLRMMWINNPDGAGIAYSTKNSDLITIEKGFMTYEKFEKRLLQINKEVNLEEQNLLLHFRISTCCGVAPEYTHPFPLNINLNRLKELKTTAPIVIAHNGVLYDFINREYSDSQIFTSKLAKEYVNNHYDLNKSFEELKNKYDDINYSRFCILEKDNFILYGDWITDESGIFYSNSSYDNSYYNLYDDDTDYYDDYTSEDIARLLDYFNMI